MLFLHIVFIHYSNFLFDFSVFCYKGFDDKIARNCLKYIPEAITYPEAEARCRKDGGALFKVDSRTKFDILKEYIGMFGFCIFQDKK